MRHEELASFSAGPPRRGAAAPAGRVGGGFAGRRAGPLLRPAAVGGRGGHVHPGRRRRPVAAPRGHRHRGVRRPARRACARHRSRLRRRARAARRRPARAGDDPAERDTPRHSGAAVRHLARHRAGVEAGSRHHSRHRAHLLRRLQRHPGGGPAAGRAGADPGRRAPDPDSRGVRAIGHELGARELQGGRGVRVHRRRGGRVRRVEQGAWATSCSSRRAPTTPR